MKPALFTPRAARWLRNILGSCLLLAVMLSAVHSQFDPFLGKGKGRQPPTPRMKLPVEPGAVEVSFTDGSNLKMLLRDDKIVFVTAHGKLLIAVTDIQRIEFATRVSEEDEKRIRAAIADLGDSEFRKREAANAVLLKLHVKAYPALLHAAEQKDAEVVRRAKELLRRIQACVTPDRLVVHKNDVIYTADSMIAGRIEGVALKAYTSQFGAVKLKLADARSLRSQAVGFSGASASALTPPSPSSAPLPSPPPPRMKTK